jgi:hypothetical protein
LSASTNYNKELFEEYTEEIFGAEISFIAIWLLQIQLLWFDKIQRWWETECKVKSKRDGVEFCDQDDKEGVNEIGVWKLRPQRGNGMKGRQESEPWLRL